MYPEGGDGALAFEPALTEAPSKRSDQRLATALRIAASDNDKRMRAPRAMEYGYSYEPESRAEPD